MKDQIPVSEPNIHTPQSRININLKDISDFLDWHKGLDIWTRSKREWFIKLRLLPSNQEYTIKSNKESQPVIKEIIELNRRQKQNIYWVTGICSKETEIRGTGRTGCTCDKDIEERLFYLLDFDKESRHWKEVIPVGLSPCLVVETSNRQEVSRNQLFFYCSDTNVNSLLTLDANKELAISLEESLGADIKCRNHSRIMRLPGTINWKEGEETTVSRLVGRSLQVPENTYSCSQIDGFIDKIYEKI